MEYEGRPLSPEIAYQGPPSRYWLLVIHNDPQEPEVFDPFFPDDDDDYDDDDAIEISSDEEDDAIQISSDDEEDNDDEEDEDEAIEISSDDEEDYTLERVMTPSH